MGAPRRHHVIGLDIGSHCLKLVELEETRRGMYLRNFGMAILPHRAIHEGAVVDRSAVAASIRNLVKHLKVRNRHVATSVSGYGVIVKRIQIYPKEGEALESAVFDEAEQYVPFDMSDIYLDFDVLSPTKEQEQGPETPTATQKGVDVLLVAAKRDLVEGYQSLLEEAHLRPAIVDVDLFALQNAVEMNIQNQEGCFALVHMGGSELGINVVHRGVTVFSRETPYGGSQISERIKTSFQVSYEDAEAIKLGGAKIPEGGERRLREIFVEAATLWVREVKRALDFVLGTHTSMSLDKILLSGGSSRLPGLRQYLAQETRCQVEEFNPFQHLYVDESRFDPAYLRYVGPQAAVAVGLASRTLDDK